jgi:hypothetical protein
MWFWRLSTDQRYDWHYTSASHWTRTLRRKRCLADIAVLVVDTWAWIKGRKLLVLALTAEHLSNDYQAGCWCTSRFRNGASPGQQDQKGWNEGTSEREEDSRCDLANGKNAAAKRSNDSTRRNKSEMHRLSQPSSRITCKCFLWPWGARFQFHRSSSLEHFPHSEWDCSISFAKMTGKTR